MATIQASDGLEIPARKRNTWKYVRIALFYIALVPLLLVWLTPIFMTLLTSVRSLDDITRDRRDRRCCPACSRTLREDRSRAGAWPAPRRRAAE